MEGNQMKMREALSDACYAMFNFLKTQSGGYEEMAIALDKAKSALAAPARNCDLPNTYERFCEFCASVTDCGKCPLPGCGRGNRQCYAAWLLATAEKGGAE